jgi:hypothetical protein
MRFIFNAVFVLLGVVAIASGLLWVRSYRVSDDLTWDSAKQVEGKWEHVERGVFTGRGKFLYYMRPWVTYREAGHPPKTGLGIDHFAPSDPAVGFPGYTSGKGRFGFWRINDYWVVGSKAVVIPFWAPFFACGVLPAVLLTRWASVRRYRRRRGLCLACGYDVRASGERCPECGAVVRGKNTLGEAAVPQ